MSTQAMKVDNTAFLIERLAADCAPNQYVRELTSNAIQAIVARRDGGWGGAGQVVWDVSWNLVDSHGLYKLRLSDNGTGMTGDDIKRYINHLSSSGRVQHLAENFGLGAKITASVQSPLGLVYESWKDGSGIVATLWRDPKTGYGLRQYDLGHGRFDHVAPPDPASVPLGDNCGTTVTLLGKHEDEHTFMPQGASNKWLIKYLNDRYFCFPENVVVKVRNFSRTDPTGWPARPDQGLSEIENGRGGSQLKTIFGMQENLSRVSTDRGIVKLSDANAYWWLLPEEEVRQTDIWESKAHAAALYQGELYEFSKGLSGRARIRDFGIVFGTHRIVIYVEPDPQQREIYANTARSSLLANGETLPWQRWAAEFRSAMPAPLRDMMDAIARKSGDTDHRESIRRRLKEIQELLKPSRYRRMPGGPVSVDGEAAGGETGVGSPQGHGNAPSGTRGGSSGSLYGRFVKSGGDDAVAVTPREDIPEIKWISITEGTRDRDDGLDDRAARYSHSNNLIEVNSDFRLYQDLLARCEADFNPAGDPNISAKIKDVAQENVSLQVAEVVLGVLALGGSPEWGSDVVQQACSEVSLTAALIPRYALLKSMNRQLGHAGFKRNSTDD